MKKPLICMLLALSSLLSLASCASDNPGSTDTTAADTTAPEVTTEARLEPDIPEGTDFGGYEFKVLTKGQTNIHWKSKDIAAEEQNGDPINDAVYERNSKVGEKYNFKVADIPMKNYGAWAAEVSTAVLSGENAYDMFCFDIIGSITSGYIYDIYDIPTINIDRPYYDQNMREAMEIAGKLFAVTGDMLIMDNDATLSVQFNKKLANDYNVASAFGADDLYTLAREGKWTFDVLYGAAQAVAKDLNGNGKTDYLEDQWGIQTENFNFLTLLNAAGEFIVTMDSEGYPRISLSSDRVASVIEKSALIQNDTKVSLKADDAQYAFTDVWGECMDRNFVEGRVLFSISPMNRVTLFRPMEIDFGVLPVPKFDEAQDRYYCTVSPYTANFIAFPATMTEAERNGMIVEALSCESMYTLTPAYYDKTLNGKAVRDEESSEMLDIIFSSTVMDLGHSFGWGGLYSALQYPQSFASNLAANETKALKEIDEAMAKLLG